mmetsp:Transcript_22183/g.34131  ORF Transcript_22183/g.34131 Transcript_22183/m.34131 type:complete len:596 (+) Transcript_22183:33-1820(+)
MNNKMGVQADGESTSSRNGDNNNSNNNKKSNNDDVSDYDGGLSQQPNQPIQPIQQQQQDYQNIHPEELLAAEYDLDLENIDLNLELDDLNQDIDSAPNTNTNTNTNTQNKQAIIANRQGGVFRDNTDTIDTGNDSTSASAKGRGKKANNHYHRRHRSRSIPSYDYDHAPHNHNNHNHHNQQSPQDHDDQNQQHHPQRRMNRTLHSSDDDILLEDNTTATTATDTTATPLCESIVNLFRRVLPSSFSSTAWWLSVHTLGLCDMILLEVDGSDFSVTIADTHRHDHTYLKFGLWAYSDVTFETYDDDFVMFYVNQWEQLHQKCIYPLKGGMYGDTPLFVMDTKFVLARICALLTTASGFICMMILWAAVVRESLFQNIKPFGWRTWVIGIQLLCCFFEAMTLMVLKSQMCNHDHTSPNNNGQQQDAAVDDDFSPTYYYRNCEIDQGASIPILSCCFWFFAIIAMLTWPKEDEPQYSHTFRGFWSDLATEHHHYSRGGISMSSTSTISTTTPTQLQTNGFHHGTTTTTSAKYYSQGVVLNGLDSPSTTSHAPENEDLVLQTSHHDGLHDIVTYSSQSQLQHLDNDDDDHDDDEGHHFT